MKLWFVDFQELSELIPYCYLNGLLQKICETSHSPHPTPLPPIPSLQTGALRETNYAHWWHSKSLAPAVSLG